MQYNFTLLALVAATTVIAAPLNINMGAYSPALVVGDGAIGFKGTQSVANLMNTLQGAATNSAAANGAAAPGTPAAAPPAAVAPAAEAAAAAVVEPQQGMGKNVNILPTVTRSLKDNDDLTPEELEELEEEIAEEDAKKRSVADDDLTPEELEELEEEIEEEDAKKRSVADDDLTPEELEELEEEIAEEDAKKRSVADDDLTPEELEELEEEIEEEDAKKKFKRDIAGFNAALSFASAALKTAPEVQLGTGEGGSGVGITQKAGGVTSTPAKTNGTARSVVIEA